MKKRLISREALKEFINEVCFSKEWAKYRADKGTRGQIECILTYIDNAPTVEERPQGEWVKIGDIGLAYTCNKCGEVNVIPTNFCPNCGAKMKGGTE